MGFESLGLIPCVDLRGGAETKIQLFQNMVSVAYQIKGNALYSNMVANMLATDTPSTSGMGSKQFFLSG